MSKLRVSFAVLLMIVAVSSLSAAQQYTVTDLGTLGGSNSSAFAINDLGQVVGCADTVSSLGHSFIWSAASGMHDIGTLGHGPRSYSCALGINNAGQVVGYTNSGNGLPYFWTQRGGMQSLGTLGGSGGSAYAINSSGQVVGGSWLASNLGFHAFLWTASAGLQDLGSLGGESAAAAINDSGDVVGQSFLSDGLTERAFLWTQDGGMQDLQLSDSDNAAFAINNLGVMSVSIGNQGYVRSTDGLLKKIGNSTGFSVSDRNVVVGRSNLPTGEVGFIWTQADGLQNLNDLVPPNSGWNIQIANAINQSGQIVATGSNGVTSHALLLTPTKQPSRRSKP
jgi:probable HAF family extracellular repeat protein